MFRLATEKNLILKMFPQKLKPMKQLKKGKNQERNRIRFVTKIKEFIFSQGLYISFKQVLSISRKIYCFHLKRRVFTLSKGNLILLILSLHTQYCFHQLKLQCNFYTKLWQILDIFCDSGSRMVTIGSKLQFL